MSFQSLSFFIFLALTGLLCLSVGRKNKAAAAGLLLVACGVFYLWSLDRQALSGFLVLLGGAIISYGTVTGPKRKSVYLLAVCWHIGALLWFKCIGFFNPELYRGWMPLGLSFFTFQQLWLLHESYTGEVILRKQDGKDFLLYSFFFPSVTSGPILKPQNFFPQLKSERFLAPDWQDVSAALYAITLGTAKKVLLADPLGTVVANGWAMTDTLSAPGAWITMLAYTLQLYLDFSGYCDIAAGCARLFGIRLPVNFNSPYRSLSVGEFWKRWHITLTSFLRECLYFPLGGSRKGKLRTNLNLMIVFAVSGLWHGAGLQYLIWGLLHGGYQVVGRLVKPLTKPLRERLDASWLALPGKWMRIAWVFFLTGIAWVFFRANDLDHAMLIFQQMAVGGGFGGAAAFGMVPAQLWLLGGCRGGLFVGDLICRKCDPVERLANCVWLRYTVWTVLLLLVLCFGAYGTGYNAAEFGYFQF